MKTVDLEEIFKNLDLKIKEIIAPSSQGWKGKEKCVKTEHVNLEDFGFCKDGEFTDEDKEILRNFESWIEKNFKSGERNYYYGSDGKLYINEVEIPEEIWKPREEVYKRVYSQFVYPAPGYIEKTLKHAKEHNYTFSEPIPAGSTIVISYPLKNPVIFETKVPLKDSYELMKFFCSSYNMTYELEEKTSENNPDLLPGMYNRNTTSGIFGIWGHEIGDLVLEGMVFDKLDNGKINILPIMGS
jgi:hypothetical protein